MKLLTGKIVKLGGVIAVISICLVILGIILTGINHFRIGSQLASVNQVSNLSHLLVRQQAKLFSLMLVKNSSNEDLIDALNVFAKEEFVIDANLYATNGSLIAQSQHAKPFVPFAYEKQVIQNTQQVVEPIFSQREIVGFLRVTFDSQYAQTTQAKVNDLFYLLYGELVILFLSGGLFVSCFYAFSRRRAVVVAVENKRAETRLTQSQRFHSRRRAFRRK